ncbi:unnamed protein product, partial [Vitis vinifera]
MNATPRREPSINPDAFLIDDVPSSNALDSLSSSSRVSGVTLAETQSSPTVMTDSVKAAQFPEVNVPNSQEDTVLTDFTQMEGIIPESTVEIPNVGMVGTETGSPGYMDPMAGILDGVVPAETDEFSLDSNNEWAFLHQRPRGCDLVLPFVHLFLVERLMNCAAGQTKLLFNNELAVKIEA